MNKGKALKDCPFCGGRQTYRKHDGGVWLTTTNHKRGCIMRDALAFVAFDTEADAIAAWNTRTDDYRQAAEYWQRMYDEAFAERTCRNISGVPLKFKCSKCGDILSKPSIDEFNYCPSCGRKVVGV